MPIEEKTKKYCLRIFDHQLLRPKNAQGNRPEERQDNSSETDMEEESKSVEADLAPRRFELEEHIDCLDTVNHWLNAVVTSVRNNQIRVHYNGWSAKYDEWIDVNSPRILKQWERGKDFMINNRIDVLDERENWLEARVIDMTPDKIKIHYYGYSSKFDEWIPKNSDRIAEVGLHSKAYGKAKYKKENTDNQHRQKLLDTLRDEEDFKNKLEQKRLVIKEMHGDGNCLFRAFSDQLYGDQKHYAFIRQVCMDYIETERDFYKNFVVGGNSRFDEYLARKRTDGVWGDDLEIQALSEIYDRSIEIYAYSADPMRTFHEVNQNNKQPIRLSYHGASHYNSIKKIGQEDEGLLRTGVGEVETFALRNANNRSRNRVERTARVEPGNLNEIESINNTINLSRMEFENKGRRDMQIALEESLSSFYQQQVGKMTDQELEETIKRSMDVYEEQKNEEELIKMIIDETKNEQEKVMDEELKKALEESKKIAEVSNLIIEGDNMYPTGVRQVIEAGFLEEYVLAAYSVVGDNPDLIINYIEENFMSFND